MNMIDVLCQSSDEGTERTVEQLTQHGFSVERDSSAVGLATFLVKRGDLVILCIIGTDSTLVQTHKNKQSLIRLWYYADSIADRTLAIEVADFLKSQGCVQKYP